MSTTPNTPRQIERHHQSDATAARYHDDQLPSWIGPVALLMVFALIAFAGYSLGAATAIGVAMMALGTFGFEERPLGAIAFMLIGLACSRVTSDWGGAIALIVAVLGVVSVFADWASKDLGRSGDALTPAP